MAGGAKGKRQQNMFYLRGMVPDTRHPLLILGGVLAIPSFIVL